LTGQDLITILGGWEGYHLGTIGTCVNGKELWVELFPDDQPGICDGCESLVSCVHDISKRWVRDLPVFDKATRLLVHRRRLLCGQCGPKLERLSWLDRSCRYTRRFADSVARWAKVATHKHIATEYGIHRHTVKRIDKAYLERELGPVDLSGIELLAMDEFAIQKGHRYATVIVDPSCKRVLWVCRGRGRNDIRPFFEQLG